MRAAARMIGQVLTMPIGIAHEGAHSFAAALCGCDTQIVVDPDGSSCHVDFDDASRAQRPLIALAPTFVAAGLSPLLFAIYLSAGPAVAVVAAVALGLFGYPSAADRAVARGAWTRHDRSTAQGAD